MTVDTGSHSVLDELLAMNIRMAVLALGGRGGKVCSDELGLHVRRLVTIDAGSSPVRSHQWE